MRNMNKTWYFFAGIFFFLLGISFWVVSCSGSSLKELNEQAEMRSYEGTTLNDTTIPLIFSPFQIVSVWLDYRYFQKIKIDDVVHTHDLWLVPYHNKEYTVWSTFATGDDVQFGSQDSSIFQSVLWFLPPEKIHEDPALIFEKIPAGETDRYKIEYHPSTEQTVSRLQIHSSNPKYGDFSGHKRDPENFAASLFMFQMNVFGTERSMGDPTLLINEKPHELLSTMGTVFSMVIKGLYIGGVVSGSSEIATTSHGIKQTFNHQRERLFSVLPIDENHLRLQWENEDVLEFQDFKKRSNAWECYQVSYILHNQRKTTMTFNPPLFDIRYPIKEPQKSTFTITLDDTGAEITGEVILRTEKDGKTWAHMLPDSPKWCKLRPVHTQIDYSKADGSLHLTSKVDTIVEKTGDEFDF